MQTKLTQSRPVRPERHRRRAEQRELLEQRHRPPLAVLPRDRAVEYHQLLVPSVLLQALLYRLGDVVAVLGVEEPPELGLGEDAGVVDDGPLLGRLPPGGVEGSEPGQEIPNQ